MFRGFNLIVEIGDHSVAYISVKFANCPLNFVFEFGI